MRKENHCDFDKIFERNAQVYEELRNKGVREEDLVYLHLSGNMVNIVTNMDGKTLAWILRLRRCNKAQWEIRQIADQMQQLVSEVSHYYPQILGPDCEVKNICFSSIFDGSFICCEKYSFLKCKYRSIF